jgi:hypothetical protein
MLFAQQPDSYREREPDERCQDEGLQEAGARQPYPKDKGESGQADAAHGGTECVDGGDNSAAIGPVEADAGFVLFFMRLDKAGAGREDGGEGKEEAADHGAESLCNQSGDQAYRSAEYEAENPFVGLDAFDRGEPRMHDHGSYRTTSQNANEAANQTGIITTVAVRARRFKRISTQLTHAA